MFYRIIEHYFITVEKEIKTVHFGKGRRKSFEEPFAVFLPSAFFYLIGKFINLFLDCL